jgi:tetratricopeptide (TPR) repeat protein
VSSAFAAPSGTEQAKKVYGEALAAMEAKDYATATAKFEEAYRLASDKHAFNYNIASAAELAGDCRKATNHYKMFLDLVPKHDARASAKKTLEKLQQTCIHDDETTEQLTAEIRGSREVERKLEESDRAMLDALGETTFSARFYEAAAAKFGDKGPFKRMAKAKSRAAKKIQKLMAKHDIAGEPEVDEIKIPASIEQACKRGITQEARSAEVYDKVFEMFDARDIVRLMDRLASKAELRHMTTFRDACP